LVTKNKKIFGLIGYPVKHSLSAYMHNAAFEYLGLQAHYELFEVPPPQLEDFFKNINTNNIYGLNVTIPHKESVMKFVELDFDSTHIQHIRAINTILNKNGKLIGYNTDIGGFSLDLLEKFNPQHKTVALFGAGGAARAVVYALYKLKAKEIYVYDINREKLGSLLEMMKKIDSSYPIFGVNSVSDLDIKQKDLLINATPVGMKETDPCLIDESMIHKNIFIYDLIYNPKETRLLKLAKQVKARYSNGLGMLLYQGILAFKLFTGREAPEEVMKEALWSHL